MITVRDSAPFSRDGLVRHLESQKIQTRMLFAGNLVRQPAMTGLAQAGQEVGRERPYRVVSELANTDAIMNRAPWVGIYPALSDEMRGFVADAFRGFVRGR